jgi:hypothetical protein
VEKARKPKMPDDFADEAEFLSHIRKTYSDDVGADLENRREALEDARFAAGRQWDEIVYNNRINNNKPALTINRIVAFIAQIIGNARMNETDIKIIPDHTGDKDVARVREGLIRNIQKTSHAKRAYDAAFQSCVIGGLGNFKVVVDYASDDVFEQDIKIEPIYDDQAVAWDHTAVDPTGADARHVTVTDSMPRAQFEKMFPDVSLSSFATDGVDPNEAYRDGWWNMNAVRVAEFYRVRSRKRVIALMQDNRTVDVTDLPTEEYIGTVATRPDGAPIMRETHVKYVEMYVVSGAAVLEGPYELPIKRVPVFRVPGWEINTGTYKTRFGLVRFLRDPQRLHNYWRSVIAEKLMLTPKSMWLAGKTAISGYEDAFRRAHLSNDPLLTFNDEAAQPPVLVPPAQLEAALINEAGIAAQDIKDVSNLHEASLGQTSNEVSGKAIMARQRVGEVGSAIYQDNMNMAKEEAGRVINDLITVVYDTPRVVKVLGADDEINFDFVKINFDDDPGSVDLTVGKYNVTVTTGPSYATKRIEAAESMMAAVNAMPDAFSVAADLIAEAQDWPKADKIAARLRTRMPPDILGEDDLTPEQQQQLAAQAQAAAEEAEIQRATIEAEIILKQAEAQLKVAQAEESRARAAATAASIDREDIKVEVSADKAAADIEKIEAEIESISTRDQLQTIDALTGENNVGEKRK